MEDTNANSTAVTTPTWYESMLTGIGEFTSEALAIKAAGYLKGLQEDEGLYPSSDQQLPTRVDNTGANLTGMPGGEAQLKTWLIYGGAALVILVIVFRLAKG